VSQPSSLLLLLNSCKTTGTLHFGLQQLVLYKVMWHTYSLFSRSQLLTKTAGRVGRVEWGVSLTRCSYVFAHFLRDVVFIKMATTVHCCAHLFPITC
jgi:hypothetical protein